MLSQAPDVGGPAQPLLIARGLVKHFPVKGGLLGRKATVRAVDGVSFEIRKGETLGIVGESGCGKSTTARLLMALMQPTAGEIIFDGESLTGGTLSLRDYRRQVQMVFQDSYSSLNPRLTIEESIAFAPQVHGLSAPDSSLGPGSLSFGGARSFGLRPPLSARAVGRAAPEGEYRTGACAPVATDHTGRAGFRARQIRRIFKFSIC